MVDALREHGLIERTLISTKWMRSLIVLRELEPKLRLGWSVPRLRKDPTQMWLTKLPAYAAAAWRAREAARRAIKSHMAAGRCDALMCHWRLVTPRLVEAVKDAGGELYVWTVDDGRRIGRLERLGVTGVITNDPRLFGQLPERAASRPSSRPGPSPALDRCPASVATSAVRGSASPLRQRERARRRAASRAWTAA